MGPLGKLAALALLLAGTAVGQTAELRVEVKDVSGAAMDAGGTLQHLGNGISRSFRTASDGVWTFTSLPPGRYRLEVSRSGFTTHSEVLDLTAGPPVARTVTLPLGASAFKLDVVDTTPLAGTGLALDEIPTPVQTATSKDLQQSGALDLSELLNRRLDGVHINDNAGNPFQPDVNYRGYSASPILGTPQGLSVYLDGVRMNQPFGDVVSWDLIPRVAISEATMMPGSNPLFGLNTLGGALSVQTKDGAGSPGTSIQASGGAYGRRAVEFEHGGSNKLGLNWYAAGNLFHDDGWRDASPSDVRQGFAKLGWQGASTSISLSGSYADNELWGNALQEQRYLSQNYSSVYTKPDITNNRAPSFNLSARHNVGSKILLSGNAYFRYIRSDTFSSDLNEGSYDQSVYQPSAADRAALTAAGYKGFPTSGADITNTPFPSWRCIAQVLQLDEPGEKCNGLLNRTFTRQHNWGLSGQATMYSGAGNRRNQLTFGAAHDRSSLGFQQTSQLGYLNPDHSVTGLNAFADGVTGGNVNGEPYDNHVSLQGMVHTSSLFATDTLTHNAWTLTFSGRYNRTIVDNTDRFHPTAGSGSLTSHSVFQRFNPAVGFTFRASASLNIYGNYSEGSRAPTSIELGCADPGQPCKLPNALAGDPPLNQVVTRTVEGGIRGRSEQALSWNVGAFRANNSDDILFVASTQTGFGYFRNFGSTRRQGLEGNLRNRFGRLTLGGGYTFLRATYESNETVLGSSNSSNAGSKLVKGLEGTLDIVPGNRIPLVPQHMLKTFADLQISRKLGVDADLLAVSSSFARGNENNKAVQDNKYYIGPGTSPGYAVMNLGAHYDLHRRLRLFVQMNNLLDRHFYTGALLGPTPFTATGTFQARPFPATASGDYPLLHTTFFAPGAPRIISGGMKFTF